jgi:CRP/FNR family transcriptional regulator, cyclic AMP receptor protein
MFRPPISDCASCTFGKASAPGRCPWSPVSRPAGATLVHEGEIPERLLLLREGLVAKESADGTGSVAVRGPASLLGTDALQGRSARANAVALTPVKMCALSPEQAKAWLGPEQGPARAMLDIALDETARFGDENAWRRGDCLARVARFALAQATSGSAPGRGMSKATVARVLGMRAETYSRCLRQLCDRAILDARPPHAPLNLAALEEIASGIDPDQRRGALRLRRGDAPA